MLGVVFCLLPYILYSNSYQDKSFLPRIKLEKRERKETEKLNER